MLKFGMHIEEIASSNSKLNANFDMKDLGNASHILVWKQREGGAFLMLIRVHWQGAYAFQYGGGDDGVVLYLHM